MKAVLQYLERIDHQRGECKAGSLTWGGGACLTVSVRTLKSNNGFLSFSLFFLLPSYHPPL